MGRVFDGAELKVAVSITGQGFDMESDNFYVIFRCEGNEVRLDKQDLIVTDDAWIAVVDTKELGSGKVVMIVHAEVPDATMPDGFRTEVSKCNVCVISPV